MVEIRLTMGLSSARIEGGEGSLAPTDNRTGRRGGRGDGHGLKPGSGKTLQQAPSAASPGSCIDRRSQTPGPALPAELGGSLRLLDDSPSSTGWLRLLPTRSGGHRDPGTGAADPRRIRGRSRARSDREGSSGSRGRPCSMLLPPRNATGARRSDRWSGAKGGRTCPAV